jgi:hypothetical protein
MDFVIILIDGFLRKAKCNQVCLKQRSRMNG